MAEQKQQATLTADQAAALLGKSRQWVFNLIKAGFIAKEARGRYTLVAIIRGVMAYYDDLLTKQTRTAAASRATDARASEIELRIAERKREIIPLEDALAEYDILVAAARREFDSIPAAFTRDVVQRRQLEALVDGAKTRLADALGAATEAARTGRSAASGSGDDA